MRFFSNDLLHIIVCSAIAFVVLFLLTKLMGFRQISQLSLFDYVNGITIGSMAAEIATDLEGDILLPLVSMVFFCLLSVLLSIATNKSIRLRRLLTSDSMILMDDGKIFMDNLRRAKLDINEFLVECRNSGYFNIAFIQTAILEPNGKVSFLPVASQRPLTPSDMNLSPKQEKAVVNVIVDGNILEGNLRFTGKDKLWLESQLQQQGNWRICDVLLATCDSQGQLSVYPKIEKPMTRDMFE